MLLFLPTQLKKKSKAMMLLCAEAHGSMETPHFFFLLLCSKADFTHSVSKWVRVHLLF